MPKVSFVRALCTAALSLTLFCGFTFSNAYRSPRNSEREVRKSTSLIILHTTEAPGKSSLRKLCERGESHYTVDTDGTAYRIIDHKRVAYHCGRSMWNNVTRLDDVSVGIEVVGYHNRQITAAQITTLKSLVKEIQNIYKIPDERVLTHSMVAYGTPNRFHKRNHRGRKRCGMQFATWSLRQMIGLNSQPRFDPDVRAKRLINADPYLAKVLYGSAKEQDKALAKYNASDSTIISAGRTAWDIARDAYNSPDTIYVFPGGTRKAGNQITLWARIPVGTKVILNESCTDEDPVESFTVVGKDGKNATELAGEENSSPTTYYIYPNGRSASGNELTQAQLDKLPYGTKILVGYKRAGPIKAGMKVYSICGSKWKAADTYFLYPHGLLKPGSEMDDNKIPVDAYLFYKN